MSHEVIKMASWKGVKTSSNKGVNMTTYQEVKGRNAKVDKTENIHQTSNQILTGSKQQFLHLKSQIRTYKPTKNTKKASRPNIPPPSHMIDHMTSNYGDVTPPPTPSYKGLAIGF